MKIQQLFEQYTSTDRLCFYIFDDYLGDSFYRVISDLPNTVTKEQFEQMLQLSNASSSFKEWFHDAGWVGTEDGQVWAQPPTTFREVNNHIHNTLSTMSFKELVNTLNQHTNDSDDFEEPE